jgi:hypothetical protein
LGVVERDYLFGCLDALLYTPSAPEVASIPLYPSDRQHADQQHDHTDDHHFGWVALDDIAPAAPAPWPIDTNIALLLQMLLINNWRGKRSTTQTTDGLSREAKSRAIC